MDHYYSFPEDKVQEIRNAKPWMTDAKHFNRVKVSPSACIKMLTHGQSGVDKGISQSGKPVEVMGLLLGRPDIEDPRSMIITDALPMPCEGFETRVIVDDENVINYMIDMGESIEMTRPERFCGWYHTHPFDLDGTSHCYLSNTDVQTQLQWQRAEDRHGNHWLAIVIDPLLSIAQSRPEMMAFRVYPPEYNAVRDECPDGRVVREERERVSLWGACWNRYYRLEIEYFMSTLAQDTLNIMRTQLLWPKAFTSSAITSHSIGNKSSASNSQPVRRIAQKLDDLAQRSGGMRRLAGSSAADGDDYDEGDVNIGREISFTSSSKAGGDSKETKGLAGCANMAKDHITEPHSCAICSLMLKRAVFCAESSSSSESGESASDQVRALHRLLIQQQQSMMNGPQTNRGKSSTASKRAASSSTAVAMDTDDN
jgi:COP9 signalosome complex subunit 5